MIGAVTNRMAAVMWVIGVLSVVTVIDRIYYTYLELNHRPQPRAAGLAALFVRAFYWTDERATFAYDLWVIAILAFVWITPPHWLGDPMGFPGRVNQLSIPLLVSEYSPARPSTSASRIRAANSTERCHCSRVAAEANRTKTNCESPFGTAKTEPPSCPGERFAASKNRSDHALNAAPAPGCTWRSNTILTGSARDGGTTETGVMAAPQKR